MSIVVERDKQCMVPGCGEHTCHYGRVGNTSEERKCDRERARASRRNLSAIPSEPTELVVLRCLTAKMIVLISTGSGLNASLTSMSR